MRFAHVNGIVIHYRADGREGAPTVVFSNSLGTDFRTWDGVVNILSDEFRCIRYDKRGHGLSQATPSPYRMEDHANDLAALLRMLNVERAIVCGLSVGGMIAQLLASEHPGLVLALVLSDTAHKIGTREMWDSRIHAIENKGLEVVADGIIERWLSADFRNHRPYDTQGWRNMLTRTPVPGYLGTCAAIRDADLTARTEKLAVPALCLCGSEDLATPPDHVQAMSKLIADARFRLIAGAGHLPCVEKPQEFADEMTRFFAEAELVR